MQATINRMSTSATCAPPGVNSVIGESTTWHGVFGTTQSTTGGNGVSGDGPVGVSGIGRTWIGVYGETHGAENGPAGIWGEGLEGGSGVKGHARAAGTAGVAGFHLAADGDGGPGVLGDSTRGRGVQGQGAVGVVGIGNTWIGVYGETNAVPESGSAGVWGDERQGRGAGGEDDQFAHGSGPRVVIEIASITSLAAKSSAPKQEKTGRRFRRPV